MFVFVSIHRGRSASAIRVCSSVKLYPPPPSLYGNNVDGRKRITKKVTVCIKLLIKCLTMVLPELRQAIRPIKLDPPTLQTNR